VYSIQHHDDLKSLVKQVQFLQKKSVAKVTSPDSRRSDSSLSLLKLKEFLPPKLYCDRLVNIYFRQFERTMRILHIPTFRRQYEEIWIKPDIETYSSPSILPQVTAVLTMACFMTDHNPENDDQIHRAYLKGAATDLIQAWVDELDRKQRSELSTLQVRLLLLLSKSLGRLTPEELWGSTGSLVRSAMTMGLHVDSSNVRGMTPYQNEMRRRLWATILEMDMQASMFTGMPIVLPELKSLQIVPANLNDSDFDESSLELPPSHPMTIHTDNIYQVYLASTLHDRLKALSLIQDSDLSMQEAVKLGRKIESCLINKPSILEFASDITSPVDVGSLLHRVLLDLYIRRPLLCLYRPLLLGKQKNEKLYAEIQEHCLSSSLVVLSYQNLYKAEILNTMTGNPIAQQNFFYDCCKTDILWSALNICQHIKQLGQSITTDQLDSGTDMMSLVMPVQSTISCLVDRIGQRGSELKDIVVLSIALQSSQQIGQASGKSNSILQDLERILSTCREKLMMLVSTQNPDPISHTADEFTNSNPINATTVPVSMNSQSPIYLASTSEVFGSLSGLNMEFNAFQSETMNGALNLDFTQDWNWEYMWQ
jgi:hypothetical protein